MEYPALIEKLETAIDETNRLTRGARKLLEAAHSASKRHHDYDNEHYILAVNTIGRLLNETTRVSNVVMRYNTRAPKAMARAAKAGQ